MPSPYRATYTKTCEACGRTYERKRHANGCLENNTQWTNRRACGQKCGNELRKKTLAARREDLSENYQHPPCTHCGGEVVRRPDEMYKRWRRRVTCSPKCRLAAIANANPKGNPSTLMRGSRRKAPKRLAPEGYVFDGRFPTPAGLRSGWQTVSGPDAGRSVDFAHNVVTKSPTTRRMLRAALSDHPDLLDALAGTLTDSWVQQDAATRTPIT